MLIDANKKTQKRVKKYVKKNKKKVTYSCEICNYFSDRKTEYNRHLMTKKHKNNINRIEYYEKNPDLNIDILKQNLVQKDKCKKKFVCVCGKKYSHNSSFTRHKKNCPHNNNMKKHITSDANKKLVQKLIEKCDNLENIMSTPNIINNTTINNNNNHFNMGIFLNENCKDAMNIKEFVNSINYNSTSWDKLKNDDYYLSLKNLIVENLSELDITKRPIHCTDMKRKTMYIKDDNLWEKDDNKCFIKKTIREISNNKKNADVIIVKEWRTNNPQWMNDEYQTKEYMTASKKPFKKIDDVEEIKLINEISKITILDKNTLLNDESDGDDEQ